MQHPVLAVAAVLSAALSACAAVPPADTDGPVAPGAMQCNAAGAAWAVGQAPTAEVVERVRIDSHSRIARVLRPGQVITMEFSAERVNIKLDEHEVIVDVTCG